MQLHHYVVHSQEHTVGSIYLYYSIKCKKLMATGTKIVSTGTKFLWQTKIYLDIVPFLCETKRWFALFLSGTKYFDWPKTFCDLAVEFVNTQNLPLISVYVETARQVPGATIQIQTSAVTTINRTWKIKTISLECETAFKYELEPSTLKWKKNN